MCRVFCTVSLTVTLLALSCAVADVKKPTGSRATSLTQSPSVFRELRVLVATSMPPQFEIMMSRAMPTPGWSFVTDSLEIDDEAGRIVAQISEIRPEGVTAQVITSTSCRLQLGTLAPRRYLLEIWLRRGTGGAHALTQAIVLVAR